MARTRSLSNLSAQIYTYAFGMVVITAALVALDIHVNISSPSTTGPPAVNYAASIELGRILFSDKSLSADGTVSCSSCHMLDKKLTDGRSIARGTEGRAGTRNTPSLLAAADTERSSFFWDGRRSRLDTAVMDPFTNSVEMGLLDQQQLRMKISSNPRYQYLFDAAFSKHGRPLSSANIAVALIAYIRSIKTEPTAYERYVTGDEASMSPQARMGMKIFSGKGQCSSCHTLTGRRFADYSFHRTGVGLEDIAQSLPELTSQVASRSLEADKLGDWIATHPREAQLGRFIVTHRVADIGTFATPSLRHVSLTAPYMHDGSIATLDEAIDREVYYRGLDTGYPMGLTIQERRDLRSFLEAL